MILSEFGGSRTFLSLSLSLSLSIELNVTGSEHIGVYIDSNVM